MLSAALLALGSGAVLWGATQRPATDAELAPLGSAEYVQVLAENIVAAEHEWRAVHAALLAGALLWALGAPALRMRTGGGFTGTGLLALGMGAALWTVALVLDGFVAPVRASAAAAQSFTVRSLDGFRATHEAAATLGVLGWLLIGLGVAALSSAAVAARELPGPVRFGTGVPGVLVGLWPLAAVGAGFFRPGVFTSELWRPTAAVTAVWFVVAAAALVWTSLVSAKQG
ncbi:hypothetical protein B0I33_106244 [Prauserella shujinwangii]|uniref:Uncharacterized protein n=1 Tax=Prauserella shujinwangii TaxID=1453103 RepID=A0A2T0LTU3_9PSEU|nr:hypothetical protein B0I33_106244 [Prauserella shujinwangii]